MNLMLNLDVTVLVNRRVGDAGFVFFKREVSYFRLGQLVPAAQHVGKALAVLLMGSSHLKTS